MVWKRRMSLGAALVAASLGLFGVAVPAAHAASSNVGPPGSIEASPAAEGAHVQWSPVAGAISYEVTADPGGATCQATTTSCLLSGLVDGTPTTFTVTASTGDGTSAPSSPSNSVTPEPDIDPPQVVSVDLSTDRVPASGGTVTARLHITDDGSGVQTLPPPSVSFNPVSYFAPEHPSLQLSLESGTTTDGIWTVDYPLPEGSQLGRLIMSISDLSDAAGHSTFALPALTEVGFGTTSAVTDLTTTQLPGRTLHLSWSPPSDDGGSPITGYVVMAVQPGDPIRQGYSVLPAPPVASLPPSTTSWDYDASGLDATTPYGWAVAAVNGAGPSPDAVSTGIVHAAATAPDAPRMSPVTVGDHSLSVWPWAPDKDGGAPILRYVLHAFPGDHTCTSAKSLGDVDQPKCTLTGLTSNVQYRLTLTAYNAVGSADSEPVSATPAGLVDPPVTVSSTAVRGGLRVRWTPPADGSAADGFEIDAEPDSRTATSLRTTAPANARECLLAGAVGGVSYRVSVRALLAGTESAPSNDAWVVAIAEQEDTAHRFAVIDRRATSAGLSWKEPMSDAGIDRYEVRLMRGDHVVRRTTLLGSATAVTLRHLAARTAYRVSIRVHGLSGWSAPITTSFSTKAR